MARRRGVWGMAGLTALLALAGLILMHGLDAGAVRSMSNAGHEMHEMVASHVPHVEEGPGDAHGCDGCHLAGHVTAVCVAALVSVALWRVGRVRLSKAGAEQPPPGRRGGTGPPRPVPRGHPAWLELSVILR